ncbi:MAG: transketolase C-terminal domain-containing protein [Kiritimatiellia bacterium]|nr:transketolase C-terminal domain-containing protein [Kiritimatiellia bacterium]
MSREISFIEAVREATDQEMERDENVVLYGLGVDDPKAIQGTTKGLAEKYGPERVFDTPLSEEAMTGVGIGMAWAGLRPIHVHIRMDFVLLAANQIINMAAKSYYMFGGKLNVPLVIRAMIGKSWGQGPQHSQSLYSIFMHVPGIKIVAPTTPHDAKGCLIAAIRDNNPVLYVEHRMLHFQKGPVPKDLYEVPPGHAQITAEGVDITLVGISFMQLECLRAQHELAQIGIQAEVIDPIWLAPLDIETILSSVKKTKKLLVVDNGWTSCGAGSTIVARIAERMPADERFIVKCMGFEPIPCPTTPVLEDLFYPNPATIAATAYTMVTDSHDEWIPTRKKYSESFQFHGPF